MRVCPTILTALLLTVFFAGAVWCQVPGIEWQHSFGGSGSDIPRAMQPTPEGGYILAGASRSSDYDLRNNKGGYDFWVVQMTSGATLDWQKNYGGSGDDFASAVSIFPDSGFIVVGASASRDGDITNPHGGYDIWMLRCSNVGRVLWEKSIGGSGDDYATCVRVTPDGGCIISGYSNSIDGNVPGNRGKDDCWVIKLSKDGNIQWQQTYGGSGNDRANGIELTTDGGYIVAGYSNSTDGQVSGGHGGYDVWILKLGSHGELLWQKTMGGSRDDLAESIQQTPDGGYIIAGQTQSSDGDINRSNQGGYDYWIVKLNGTGDIEWQQSPGGSSDDLAYAVRQMVKNEFVVVGYTASNNGDVNGNHGGKDVWLVALNGKGDLLWQKTIGGSGGDIGYDLQFAADSTILIAGVTASVDGDIGYNYGKEDYWVIKTASCIPWINITAAAGSSCVGGDLIFTATTRNAGGQPRFQWIKNGIEVSSNSGVYRPANLSAGDTIYCILTANASCTPVNNRTAVSNRVVVNTSLLNPSPLIITADTNTVCAGALVHFGTELLSSATNVQYQWLVNGNVLPGETEAGFTTDQLSNQDRIVCRVVYNIDTCTKAAADTLIMQVLSPKMPVVTIAGPDVICENQTAVFTATVFGEGRQPVYQWQVNGLNRGEPASRFSSLLEDGDLVRCIVTGDQACSVPAGSNEIQIKVEPAPKITALQNITLSSGGGVPLQAIVSGNVQSYNWTPAQGLSDSSILNPVARPTQTTVYRLEAVSANGCKTTGQLTVTVIHTLSVPSAFSPNGDGINDAWLIRGIAAYPGLRVKVFDRYGKEVFHSTGYQQPWDGTRNGKPLPAGVYYFVIDIEKEKPVKTGSVMLIR